MERKGAATSSLSLFALLAVWYVVALVSDPSVFPGPGLVFDAFIVEFQSGELLTHLAATLGRVILAFGLAWIFGGLIGFVLGRFQGLDNALWVWVSTFLNMPALVVMVVCYLALGMTETAAVIAVAVNKAPLIAVNLRDGVRQLDPKYDEFAKTYGLSLWQTFRYVWLPQLEPFLFTALRTGLSLTWKVILVVELLGRSSGVGFQIHLYFQLFQVDVIFVYALSFILVMQLIEWGCVRPVEKYVQRWRVDGQLARMQI